MRKLLSLLLLLCLFVACKHEPNIYFDKPILTLNPEGDTVNWWIYNEKNNEVAKLFKRDTSRNSIIDFTSDTLWVNEYNDKDQIIKSGTCNYEYDDRGNVIRILFCGNVLNTLKYNDRNLLVSNIQNNGGFGDYIGYTSWEYEYEGNKQTEIKTFYDINTKDSTRKNRHADTIVRYYMDPEFKYDTLFLQYEKGEVLITNRTEWIEINGKYYKSKYTSSMTGWGTKENYWTYDENGVIIKLESGGQTVTYTVEGNKVTDNKGNVTYYLQR